MIDIEDRIQQKEFDEIGKFNDNKYAYARIENKVGVIDFYGNVIIPFEYEAEYNEVFDPHTMEIENKGYYLTHDENCNDLFVLKKMVKKELLI